MISKFKSGFALKAFLEILENYLEEINTYFCSPLKDLGKI